MKVVAVVLVEGFPDKNILEKRIKKNCYNYNDNNNSYNNI